MKKGEKTNLNNSLLSPNSYPNPRLRQRNIHILSPDIPRNWDRHVHVADRLRPFIRELRLFCIFLGLALFFFEVAVREVFWCGVLFEV